MGSESTTYRVLRERGQAGRRGRAKTPRKSGPPTTHRAAGPCEVWSWDITWLPGPVPGVFFHLDLILDIWSRKITGWEVHDCENGELAAQVVEKAVWAEGCVTSPLTLHADNGSLMKASSLRVTLERLGVTASFSRPRVGNDNPFSEALFRTCKYVPSWPEKGFESLEAARAWVADFVRWYNGEHRHSAIRFVTPDQRHCQQDRAILNQRDAVYQAARARHPERWSRGHPLLAAHRRCLAQPRTAGPGAQRPWGRRRAPPESWRRRPRGRPATPDDGLTMKPEPTTTLTDTAAGKGYGNRPLDERGKQGNRTKSSVRGRVEHIFGAQANDMGGVIERTIGLARAKVKIGLKNLSYNMRRLGQLRRFHPGPAKSRSPQDVRH